MGQLQLDIPLGRRRVAVERIALSLLTLGVIIMAAFLVWLVVRPSDLLPIAHGQEVTRLNAQLAQTRARSQAAQNAVIALRTRIGRDERVLSAYKAEELPLLAMTLRMCKGMAATRGPSYDPSEPVVGLEQYLAGVCKDAGVLKLLGIR